MNALKRSIIAPPGHMIINADLSQIEARVLAWLAGQQDLVEQFARGEDVYKIMAGHIYNKSPEEIDGDERFIGKTTLLGSGYGMGPARFKDQLWTMGKDLDIDECGHIIRTYRETYPHIKELWRSADRLLQALYNGDDYSFGACDGEPVVSLDIRNSSVIMPSGLPLVYPQLAMEQGEYGPEFSYTSRRGTVKLYGAKFVENLCQGLARCVVAYHMLEMQKLMPVVMTVHDSLISVVPTSEVDGCVRELYKLMRIPPAWAKGLPLDCEVEVGDSYGSVEKVEG